MKSKLINRLVGVLSLFMVMTNLNAQIVVTDPSFATQDDQVTITYDATQGTGALAGLPVGQKVYAHLGLVTASGGPGSWQYVVGNWGTADDRTEMTRVGNSDLWTLTFSPSLIDWFDENNNSNASIPSNTEVVELALVFRNANGSLEGKTDDGSDIFIPIYDGNQGFIASFSAPTEYSSILDTGDELEVLVSASEDSEINLYDNGELLTSGTGNSLSYTVLGDTPGDHELVMEAIGSSETVYDTVFYVVNGTVNVQPYPNGTEPGINRLGNGHIRFALTAPGKDYVYLIGDFNNWTASADFFMNESPDGVWWLDVEGLDPATEYAYQYFVDGELRIADPYSEIILDPYNDGYISEETFPNLKAYPFGKTTGNATSFYPEKPVFDWQHDDVAMPAKEEMVIYEVLIRDFVESQNYLGLMEKLDYLENLGINAIELMPVMEFEGNLSWGYNVSFHHALDKYYGSPELFKTFVDECHSRGIAVLLDIALNHGFSQCPLAQLYWDASAGPWGKPAADNPWFNVDPTHNFNVGSDFNHESPYTQYYSDRVIKHWVEEYHIDGYRFDLTKGITQNVGGSWDAGGYDQSRIDLLKRMGDVVWSVRPDATLILEHFADNSEEKVLSEFGFMLWGNMNYQYNEATMGYGNDLSWGVYKSRNWSDPHLITYMESHDEERLMFKNLEYGSSLSGYDIRDFGTALARQELANTVFLTIPGPKMIWQFGELGYEYSIFTCSDGTVNLNDDGCKLSPKPIVWHYLNSYQRVHLHDVVRSLNALRAEYPVFHTSDFEYNLSNTKWKRILLQDSDMDVLVLGAFDLNGETVNAGFSHTGTWYEYYTGASIEVTDVNMAIELAAGEYRLYTDQDIGQADVNNSKELNSRQTESIKVYPNPVMHTLNIDAEIRLEDIQRARILFADGRSVYINSEELSDWSIDLSSFNLSAGQYFIELMSTDKMYFGAFSVVK